MLDITSSDIKANCDDLKVLGKGDFKVLLKWRLAIREEVYFFPVSYFHVDNEILRLSS